MGRLHAFCDWQSNGEWRGELKRKETVKAADVVAGPMSHDEIINFQVSFISF